MNQTSSKIEMVLTLTQKNLYCILFQEGQISETFIFSSIDPFNNLELKEFLNLHRFCIASIVVDLPNTTLEHLKLNHLTWWKQKLFFLKNSFKPFLYEFPSGISYSHSYIHLEKIRWKEWSDFIHAQQYVYLHIIPLPLLWSHFPFKKYTTKEWIIVVWQTPENDLRYFAFFKQTLVYCRSSKEMPLNLEEEIFNLHTYLKRTYAFNPANSVLMMIDFTPDHPLSAFDFEQEPILIDKTVLLHPYKIPADNLIYAVHYPFLQSFEKIYSRLSTWIFLLRFFLQNRKEHFLKNINKGLLGIFIYFFIRCAYLMHQSHTLENVLIPLNNEDQLIESEKPLPTEVLKGLVDSVPSDTNAIIGFFEKQSAFHLPNLQIEGWEWKNFDHRPGYKVCLRLQLELEEGQDKKALFKSWKEHFKPLLLTIVKKKILKKAFPTDGRQKWLIDIEIETNLS